MSSASISSCESKSSFMGSLDYEVGEKDLADVDGDRRGVEGCHERFADLIGQSFLVLRRAQVVGFLTGQQHQDAIAHFRQMLGQRLDSFVITDLKRQPDIQHTAFGIVQIDSERFQLGVYRRFHLNDRRLFDDDMLLRCSGGMPKEEVPAATDTCASSQNNDYKRQQKGRNEAATCRRGVDGFVGHGALYPEELVQY
ncbi:ADP-glucose pyrophosphorylase [Zymobacter palmae]|uniref:ADP-glucose pyrophosphorylase n=1 Tax=Zymobacter palmae TaxID=33074 RepID=A0A348HFE7_9GAMM|nr:ADP-glucose pyrophosphorylase [Zymobacter palmae]